MFGQIAKRTGSSSSGKGLKCLMGAVAGVAMFSLHPKHAQAQNITLFTTHDDWSQWSNNGDSTNSESAVVQSHPDSDGSLVNGLGSPSSGSGVGNPSASGGGSLSVTESSGTYDFVYSQTLPFGTTAYNEALVNNLASNGGTGKLLLTYTIPTPQAEGTYFQVGVVFNYGDYGSGPYGGNFLFDQNSSTTVVNDGVIDGATWYTATIPYTLSDPTLMLNDTASSTTYFQTGIIINSNYDLNGTRPLNLPVTFSADNLQILVPEPASMGMLGAGLSMLTLRRRRRA